MRIRKVIHIKGMEYIDLLRELRNCGYKDKGYKDKGKKIDFTLEFFNVFCHKPWMYTPSDDIVLVIHNSDMFNDVRIKRLLFEYLL